MAYFQVLNGKLNRIECTPEVFARFQAAADITVVEYETAETGWFWDGTNATAPEPPVRTEPDYFINTETLYDLFTPAEQEDLEDSPNKKVKWFLRQLVIRRYLPAVPRLATIMNALESAGLLGEGRAAIIIQGIQAKKVTL